MIDKTLATPLYEQIANELRQEILCRKYGEHGALGTQSELTERFGVSLITIRKAIQLLVDRGMVDVQQGRGTFVRSPALVDPLRNLTAASQVMANMQVKTRAEVPQFQVLEPPAWLDKTTREALGQRCLYVCRVVTLDGEQAPFTCAEMYLPERYIGTFTQKEVEQQTIYHIYQKKLGVALGLGRQIIRAAGARGHVAAYLKLPENWPILQIERHSYDKQNRLIEYMILSAEGSRYTFEVELALQAE